MKNLLELLASNPNIQVIQGNIEEVLAQLKAEAGAVAESVGEAVTKGADTGLNAIQQLVADLNAQFGSQNVEITHRPLNDAELEAELFAMLEGLSEAEADDDRELQELSREELYELIQLQDETLEVATIALQQLREEGADKDQRLVQLEATVDLQSQLLESSNDQLTAMHEGLAQLRGLLETLKGANARLDDTHTRTVSFADILNGFGRGGRG